MHIAKRRFLSGLLSLVLLLGLVLAGPVPAMQASADGIVYGEVDGVDGISAGDALVVLQYSVQLTTLDGTRLIAADVSANGQVEWILRDALKRAGRLPKKEDVQRANEHARTP